jgi:hypothetical protein
MVNDADFNKASEQGQRLLARGPLATAARFEAGRIHVELNNGCAFEFPADHAEGLAKASVCTQHDQKHFGHQTMDGSNWHNGRQSQDRIQSAGLTRQWKIGR